MNQHYTQYGAEVSLFSGKTRAYMRYKNIPFTETLATASIINNELQPNTGLRMIPVVKTPQGEYWQDTTDIIDKFEAQFAQNSVYPVTPKQHFVALLLELYGDEWLLLPAMHYRWHYKRRHLGFILREFGACATPHWPRLLQPVSGLLPAFFFGRLYKPVLGISKRNWRAIETWYEAFLECFNTHLIQHQYVLGGRPSIADYGFIGPLYAHLYRDPYSGELMKQRAPHVVAWVERMMRGDQPVGAFLANDKIPDTLVPMLKHMHDTQLPVLHETVKRVQQRLLDKPGERLPRFLGKMRYSFDGVEETRYVNTYAQWMLQRCTQYFDSLSSEAQHDVQAWFSSRNLSGLTEIKVHQPVERRQGKLFPVASA
ncbi:glutathione S-transferase N-terminal domain-containing protein [Alteromonas oceanisediminis]|uniref:glutathione S-transferase N-terminal domain-containing protein n=1 Tax=Alteromonas oceanisediminis TaxID=2836180 RepID=UPI001BDA9453|nr:glutathione S-transferase N-terminal domain-containing protein [Alteromonas oceanisediminis]MBT0586087.1 glutathione S-transferase C-terminal domain-containing protein [Alteromonas oceanisediminis]